MKIRTRILTGFTVVALCMACFAIAAVSGMSRMNDSLGTVYNDRVAPLRNLKIVADAYAVNIVDNTHKIRAGGVGIDKGIAEINAARAVIDSSWKAYTATYLTDEERGLVSEAVRAMTNANTSVDQLLAILARRDAAALTQYATKELYAVIDPVATPISKLIELQVTVAGEEFASGTKLYRLMRSVAIGVTVLVILLALGIGDFVSRQITGPVNETVGVLEQVATGDLTQRIAVRSKDEIGQMGHALNTALEALSGAMSSIAQNAHALASSSEELSAVSTQMGANATETSAQANVVSAAAEQVSRNVQTVATGTEEMTASIREIAKNASEAAKVASSAVSVAETTNASVAKLGVSSAEIGNVIKVITSIAQQTNLLALNATIEAARAGEAGKGFAVVANEVKELAKETAKATEDISRKIEAIQSDTQVAVEAIGQIGAIIGQINDAQNTIASAVEEQTATTNEMARNVDEASKGSSEIAQNITVVAQAAESTTSGARDTQTAAGELARMAAELQSIVSRFRFESGGAAAVGSESAAGASRKPAYSPRRRTGDTLRAAA